MDGSQLEAVLQNAMLLADLEGRVKPDG